MRFLLALVLLGLFLSSSDTLGCLWDSETISSEKQRFPDVHEAIAGYFPRHSRAFYEWRIEATSKKPIEQREPIDFDDIAVAFDKLGEHEKAIEIMKDKIARWPKDYRYESEANLGTFLIHAGKLEQGLKHIQNAIEINPNAHFGREVYQQRLVEYLIERGVDKKTLPLSNGMTFASTSASYLAPLPESANKDWEQEIKDATKGILGMMRFGHYDSPILLEALGDLLSADLGEGGAKMLACRAYLKASYEVEGAASSDDYRRKAEMAIHNQEGWELEDVEAQLKWEIEQGVELFNSIQSYELEWISIGNDVVTEFDAKFGSLQPLSIDRADLNPVEPERALNTPTSLDNLAILMVVLLFAFIILAAFRVVANVSAS
ncbi:MAG: hypothetical protein AAF664_11715 [Planctomycetota bacterium]